MIHNTPEAEKLLLGAWRNIIFYQVGHKSENEKRTNIACILLAEYANISANCYNRVKEIRVSFSNIKKISIWGKRNE